MEQNQNAITLLKTFLLNKKYLEFVIILDTD